MCDQIEAELTNLVWEGKSESRAFMSFTLEPPDKGNETKHTILKFDGGSTFKLHPFALKGAIELDLEFHYYDLDTKQINEKLGQEVQEMYKQQPDSIQKITVKIAPEFEINSSLKSPREIESFYKIATGFTPHIMQREIWRTVIENNDTALLLKAPTGSGKTEAASLPLLGDNKRVVIVLPSKALLDDHFGRFSTILTELSKDGAKRLLIDTGDRSELYRFVRGAKIERDSDIKKDKHLYRGDVILTTLDKLLYRYFGYAAGRKSFTFPLRLGEKQTAFIFDEAHTYDGTSFSNFVKLLEALYLRDHPIVVMTATLPESFQKAPKEELNFDNAFTIIDYTQGQRRIDLENEQKHIGQKGEHLGQRKLEILPEVETTLKGIEELEFSARKELVENHKHGRCLALLSQIKRLWTGNEKLIVTLDRVKDAARIYKELSDNPLDGLQKGLEGNLFLYHGRLDSEWRRKVFTRVKELDSDKNNKPYILISTSTIEVGVDLDADHLLSEICTPDALIQRAGRVNRNGHKPNATVWVVGTEIPSYLNPLSPEQMTIYIDTLQNLENLNADKVAILMDVYPKPVLQDPRAEIAFDMLTKYVYDARIEYQPLYGLGFIATRSWEPTVNLCVQTSDGLLDVDVPVSRLARGTDDVEKVKIQIFTYPEERSEKPDWTEVTRGGDLYKNSYRVTLNDELAKTFERDLGFVELPRVFNRIRWPSDPPLRVRLQTFRLDSDQISEGVFYIADDKAKSKKKRNSIVFSYLAEPGLIEV
jgi:CRISPR-associated endonuclease/helicase Cas3